MIGTAVDGIAIGDVHIREVGINWEEFNLYSGIGGVRQHEDMINHLGYTFVNITKTL